MPSAAPDDPADVQRELLELLVKAGRRCAYDLRHAADDLAYVHIRPAPGSAKLYRERADVWLAIFNPDNGPKNYRAELHQAVSRLESEAWRLKALCEAHGIDHTNPDGMPF